MIRNGNPGRVTQLPGGLSVQPKVEGAVPDGAHIRGNRSMFLSYVDASFLSLSFSFYSPLLKINNSLKITAFKKTKFPEAQKAHDNSLLSCTNGEKTFSKNQSSLVPQMMLLRKTSVATYHTASLCHLLFVLNEQNKHQQPPM